MSSRTFLAELEENEDSLNHQQRKATKRQHEKEEREKIRLANKRTGDDCNCRNNCTSMFSPGEKHHLIETLCSKKTKNEQDAYLMNLIERHDVARRRPTKPNSGRHRASTYKFFAIKDDRHISVCQRAFCSLYSVSRKAAARLANFVATNQVPEDLRGKHKNRGNTLPADVVAKIDEHIRGFPPNTCQYSGRLYLGNGLSGKKMHELFLEKYPDLQMVVKYDYYLKHYRENYGYKFGRPQIDMSDMCKVEISSPEESVIWIDEHEGSQD